MQEIKTLLNSYTSSENLVNQNDRAYINLDDLLSECVYAKSPQKPKKQRKEGDEEPNLLGEFMKREELTKKITEKMQAWYEITRDGEIVLK
jgi:translation initiation factor 2D